MARFHVTKLDAPTHATLQLATQYWEHLIDSAASYLFLLSGAKAPSSAPRDAARY